MKKFKFRYESVLKMRMDKEEDLKNELAKKIKERQELLDKLEKMKTRFLEYSNWIQEQLISESHEFDLRAINDGKKYYRNNINEYQYQIQKKEKEIEAVKAKLVEAMKERKVMDKLKEKEFQNYIEEINKQDTKLIEEIVNYKSNKRGDE